jgi:hypothetical protein
MGIDRGPVLDFDFSVSAAVYYASGGNSEKAWQRKESRNMKLILITACFAGIAFFDLYECFKNKQRNEIVVYAVIFLFTFSLAALMVSGAQIPSPVKAIQKFYIDVLHLSFKK